MKKTVKVLTVLLLAIILITFATNVLAADGPIKPSDINASYGDAGDLTTKAGQIMGIILVVAAASIATFIFNMAE